MFIANDASSAQNDISIMYCKERRAIPMKIAIHGNLFECAMRGNCFFVYLNEISDIGHLVLYQLIFGLQILLSLKDYTKNSFLPYSGRITG